MKIELTTKILELLVVSDAFLKDMITTAEAYEKDGSVENMMLHRTASKRYANSLDQVIKGALKQKPPFVFTEKHYPKRGKSSNKIPLPPKQQGE